MTSTSSERGQILVEFLLSLMLVIPLLLVGGGLLWSGWNRFACARITFEATHAFLRGNRSVQFRYPQVRIGETREVVEGVGRCGSVTEKVRFLKLEPEEDRSP